MKLLAKILGGLVLITVAWLGYFFYDHADREHRATEAAIAAMASTDAVTISADKWIVFRPVGKNPTKGLIFYPGGECDERGYAEPLRDIAAAGYLVVMVPMPFQLAVLQPDKGSDVFADFPEIETWAIAGHSLGGSMASWFAVNHPDEISGLMMWDAYPTSDMSAATIPVSMIHRADQAGNTPPEYADHLGKLPENTQFFPLKGGQHLYFGDFVPGRMFRDDPPPELDPAQQRALVAAESVEFMRAL